MEYLEPHLQKKTRERREESSLPGDYLCEQDRNQGSKQPYKEGKPAAGERKKYSSITSNEYVKGTGPQDVLQDSFLVTQTLLFKTVLKCLCDEISALYHGFQTVCINIKKS